MGPDFPLQRVMDPKFIHDNGPPLVPTGGDRRAEREGREGRSDGLM
jgi:hypothetical protein